MVETGGLTLVGLFGSPGSATLDGFGKVVSGVPERVVSGGGFGGQKADFVRLT